MADESKCFQCGRPLVMVLPENASEDDWMTCGNCGERVMTVRDALQQTRGDELERAKQALGFYEFKPPS